LFLNRVPNSPPEEFQQKSMNMCLKKSFRLWIHGKLLLESSAGTQATGHDLAVIMII